MDGGQAIESAPASGHPFPAMNDAIGEHFKRVEPIATHPRSIAPSITSDVIVFRIKLA
jgi:hypothetical protein